MIRHQFINSCFRRGSASLIALLVIFASQASAQSIREFRHTSGVHSWKTASSWDPENAPDSFSERAEINDGTSGAILYLAGGLTREIDSFKVKGSGASLRIFGNAKFVVDGSSASSENRNTILLGIDDEGHATSGGSIRSRSGYSPLLVNNGTIRGHGDILFSASAKTRLDNNTGIGTGSDQGIVAQHGTLTLQARTIVNGSNGQLSANSGGTLVIQNSVVSNSGRINSTSGSGAVQYYNSVINGGKLTAGAANVTGDHQVRSNSTFNGVSVDADLRVFSGVAATLGGTVNINRTTSAPRNLEVLGSGRVQMNNATVAGNGNIDIQSSAGSIQGRGTLGVAVTNDGRIVATKGTLTIKNHVNNSGGGQLQANDMLVYDGATVTSGQLIGSGTHRVVGISTKFNGVTNRSNLEVGAGALLNNNNSTLTNLGLLQLDGTITNGGNLMVQSGGMLQGAGNFLGNATIGSGGILAPGNSPGTMGFTNMVWDAGGTLLFEINDATGLAGNDPGWDLLTVNNSLTIDATTLQKFVIDITSLELSNSAGLTANFNSLQNYQWLLATTGNGIFGFDVNKFELRTINFQNDLQGGHFSLGLTDDGMGLVLNFNAVPEPTSLALLGMGVFGLGCYAIRRRKPLETIA